MSGFTPYSALVGGVLIGASASLILLAHGRVAGVSGILGGLLVRGAPDRGFRAAFLLGLLLAGLGAAVVAPESLGPPVVALPLTALAGLLVGFGTRLGNGCTSGHGVCGISRFSGRSIVATLTFMAAGALTVFVVRHVLGVAA